MILCRSRADADAALEEVRAWVAEAGLALHPTKTRIVDSREESFAFLGYEFRGTKHWPRRKSIQKLKDRLRALTRRSSGRSLAFTVSRLNPVLRGWYGYFQHSSYATVFQDLDSWLRGRLRGILRKRHGGRGRGRGWDHHRWPNLFFVELGLFSLVAARASTRQSSRR